MDTLEKWNEEKSKIVKVPDDLDVSVELHAEWRVLNQALVETGFLICGRNWQGVNRKHRCYGCIVQINFVEKEYLEIEVYSQHRVKILTYRWMGHAQLMNTIMAVVSCVQANKYTYEQWQIDNPKS